MMGAGSTAPDWGAGADTADLEAAGQRMPRSRSESLSCSGRLELADRVQGGGGAKKNKKKPEKDKKKKKARRQQY